MASMNGIDDDVRRPTYMNLYKWPESDAEFVRWVSSDGSGRQAHPRVVEGISCRQMYLRSYTFSRRESVLEITRKCLGKMKKRVKNGSETKKIIIVIIKGKALADMISSKCLALRKTKHESYAAILSLFRRLLSCAG